MESWFAWSRYIGFSLIIYLYWVFRIGVPDITTVKQLKCFYYFYIFKIHSPSTGKGCGCVLLNFGVTIHQKKWIDRYPYFNPFYYLYDLRFTYGTNRYSFGLFSIFWKLLYKSRSYTNTTWVRPRQWVITFKYLKNSMIKAKSLL